MMGFGKALPRSFHKKIPEANLSLMMSMTRALERDVRTRCPAR
jgi:hypothetical protein